MQKDKQIISKKIQMSIYLINQLRHSMALKSQYIHTPSELYEMYHILHFLQIHEFYNQIKNLLIQDKSSILIGYQLSELYEIESLSNFYFEYFKAYGFLGIFNKKLHQDKVRQYIYKNKTRLVPLHYLYLQANLFKKQSRLQINRNKLFLQNSKNNIKKLNENSFKYFSI
ncbi:unnamed protein product [Paramecium sonneborni]|uniref:Uncharacterized protein n=1 Tax=Paramecium sonneborni TaxID=65129 RepID=A0A8S1MSQ3_9CILI|nr:unnamed protein product [Paramecium sonneborni]